LQHDGRQLDAGLRGDGADQAVGRLGVRPENIERSALGEEIAQVKRVRINLAMAMGVLGPLVAQAGDQVALFVARRQPRLQGSGRRPRARARRPLRPVVASDLPLRRAGDVLPNTNAKEEQFSRAA